MRRGRSGPSGFKVLGLVCLCFLFASPGLFCAALFTLVIGRVFFGMLCSKPNLSFGRGNGNGGSNGRQR